MRKETKQEFHNNLLYAFLGFSLHACYENVEAEKPQ